EVQRDRREPDAVSDPRHQREHEQHAAELEEDLDLLAVRRGEDRSGHDAGGCAHAPSSSAAWVMPSLVPASTTVSPGRSTSSGPGAGTALPSRTIAMTDDPVFVRISV